MVHGILIALCELLTLTKSSLCVNLPHFNHISSYLVSSKSIQRARHPLFKHLSDVVQKELFVLLSAFVKAVFHEPLHNHGVIVRCNELCTVQSACGSCNMILNTCGLHMAGKERSFNNVHLATFI